MKMKGQTTEHGDTCSPDNAMAAYVRSLSVRAKGKSGVGVPCELIPPYTVGWLMKY